jgi:peptide/nickel transport system permease protein
MAVIKALAGRLAGLVITMFIASVVVFAGLYLAPGSPLGFLTGGRSLPPATLRALSNQYGLDQPLPARYLHWITDALHGNFGESIIYQQSVSSILGPRVLTTLLLLVLATLIITVVGVGAGILAAVRGRATDTVISLTSSLGLAIPAFIAAILLIAVFAVGLHWFPVFGPGSGGLGDRVWHLALPAVALALSSSAFVARITRSATREELASDHVRTALLRGLPRHHVLRRHVVRNALIPITTVVGLTSASLIAGSIIVDQAFSLNGLGSSLVSAVNQHDYPVVQAITMIMVLAFVVINAAVDLTYSLIDPRIRRRSAG